METSKQKEAAPAPVLGLYRLDDETEAYQLVMNTEEGFSIFIDSNGCVRAIDFATVREGLVLVGAGLTFERVRRVASPEAIW